MKEFVGDGSGCLSWLGVVDTQPVCCQPQAQCWRAYLLLHPMGMLAPAQAASQQSRAVYVDTAGDSAISP